MPVAGRRPPISKNALGARAMPPIPSDIPSQLTGPATQAAPGSASAIAPLSPDRFAELFEAHSRTLWCVAVSVLGDREGAKDVVQDSAIIALRKLSDFAPGTSFAAWMSQVVKYTAMNEVRKRVRRREKAGPDAVDHAGHAAMPEFAAAFDERVASALLELDETPRACLLMKAVLSLEYKDISEALGIPEGTAMSHVFRARKIMRAQLASSHGAEYEQAEPTTRDKGGAR